MVAHMWRYRDEVRALRARIEAGELGRIVRTHGYGVHAKLGPGRLVHRPGAGGWRRADRHGHPRDRHRALPARRPRAGAGARRRSAPRSATTRSTTTASCCRLVERHALGDRVGLVGAAPGRARGRHRAVRHRRLRADLAPTSRRPATTTAPCRCTPRRWTTSCAASHPAILRAAGGAPTAETGLAALAIVERAYVSARSTA